MNFNDYQERVKGFMNPKVLESEDDTLMNAILGLNGEAGEVADVVKKWKFHEGELDLQKLDKEVGDVLFYCALYCIARRRQLEDIAQLNVDKLTARYGGQPWSAEASRAKADEILGGDYTFNTRATITGTNSGKAGPRCPIERIDLGLENVVNSPKEIVWADVNEKE